MSYAAVMYPGVLAISMLKCAYAALLLAQAVPLPPTGDVPDEAQDQGGHLAELPYYGSPN